MSRRLNKSYKQYCLQCAFKLSECARRCTQGRWQITGSRDCKTAWSIRYRSRSRHWQIAMCCWTEVMATDADSNWNAHFCQIRWCSSVCALANNGGDLVYCSLTTFVLTLCLNSHTTMNSLCILVWWTWFENFGTIVHAIKYNHRGHTGPAEHFFRTTYHQIWPPITYVEVKCHITAETVV